MSRQLFQTTKNGAHRIPKNIFAGSLCMENKNGKLSVTLDTKHSLDKFRQALGLRPHGKLAARKRPCVSQDESRLGIRLEQDVRQHADSLGPDYPLLASCYSHFGLIRLSGKHNGALCKGGK